MSNTPKWMLDPDLKTIRERIRMNEPMITDSEYFIIGSCKEDLIFDAQSFKDDLELFQRHITSLKSHPAENFTPEYAGKELEEDIHFEFIYQELQFGVGQPDWWRNCSKKVYEILKDCYRSIIAIPLSNTANPKGEEKPTGYVADRIKKEMDGYYSFNHPAKKIFEDVCWRVYGMTFDSLCHNEGNQQSGFWLDLILPAMEQYAKSKSTPPTESEPDFGFTEWAYGSGWELDTNEHGEKRWYRQGYLSITTRELYLIYTKSNHE